MRVPSEGIRAGRRDLSAQERAGYVRRMFSAVAPRYDVTNTVISAGLHRRWKGATVAALALRPGERALDLCCGTGDLARLMRERLGADGTVAGVDFAEPMIVQARRRARGAAAFLVGDALAVPFGDASFDAAAVGFGLRNVADPGRALAEIRRVLRPGGRVALLEFARVASPMLRTLYDLYSFTALAALGRLVSGHPDAYTYLPVSIRHWIDQEGMLRLLEERGFSAASYRNLAGGIVAVYSARAP
jgi:demethylmenaquinone methyltransferase/2-methoxy-6-polyprenyl-1,4-benzoquinol methylase